MPGRNNKLDRQYGWAGYIVPCDLLREELASRKGELKFEDRHPDANEDSGLAGAALRAGRPDCGDDRSRDVPTPLRRHDGVSYIINAVHAQAFLIAMGAVLEHDTDLPTLPGCLTAAEESVDAYCEFVGPKMKKLERRRLARSLMNFSTGFLYWEDVFVTEAEATEAVCKALAAAGAVEVEQTELVAA
jgi:hypothetical protein